ncbi:DUF4212 domain-containing protein [Piscinibacter sp.]|uniref:DUF4212 domain-containing protein n=1 Tax=Piscinibacter sp. TaxID=1903157 RepID=UPI0039E5EB72
MNDPSHRSPAADARHWRRNRRAALWLGACWLAISFAPLLLSRQLELPLFGAPLVFWICAQVVPLGFLLLVWRYERILDRLDRERAQGRVDG